MSEEEPPHDGLDRRFLRSALVRRSGLLVLSLSRALVGFWALLGPTSFFSEFPGLGRRWMAVLGTFNEHLTTDVGGHPGRGQSSAKLAPALPRPAQRAAGLTRQGGSSEGQGT